MQPFLQTLIIWCFHTCASLDTLRSSSALVGQPQQLRARLEEDGYLYLPSILADKEVLNVRADIVEILREHGWIDQVQADMRLGTVSTGIPPKVESPSDAEYWPVYDKVQRLESFHSLGHSASLLSALSQVFDQEPFLHPRNIARTLFPKQSPYTTPAHQDWIYNQGEARDSRVFEHTLTAWVPLGDVSTSLGGLTLLPGSHKFGIQKIFRASGAGGFRVDVSVAEDAGCRWASANYTAGDVLLFSSHLIHRGLPNEADSIRLSADYRFIGLANQLHNGSLGVHWDRLTWDEIYKDWRSDKYKYYWKDKDLNFSAYDLAVTGADEKGAGAKGDEL